jgi:aspartyl-tRNA(Asn)/glutamyl-tRNA(Gln) amidotransferase subunit B
VSVRKRGSDKLGTRAEIKNVNSFRFVEKAIEFEILRQVELVKSGGKVVQETRGYDSAKNQTYSQRSKEEAQDYRYFPDPDLITVQVDSAWIDRLKADQPELPEERRARYQKELGLTALDAASLTASKSIADFFQKTAALLVERKAAPGAVKTAANLITTDVQQILNDKDIDLSATELEPEHIADLAAMREQQVISSTSAKLVLASVTFTGEPIMGIIDGQNLRQVSDTSALEPVIEKILAANPAQLAELKAGKEKIMGFFVGQIMKQTGGKANPALLQELIRKKLGA